MARPPVGSTWRVTEDSMAIVEQDQNPQRVGDVCVLWRWEHSEDSEAWRSGTDGFRWAWFTFFRPLGAVSQLYHNYDDDTPPNTIYMSPDEYESMERIDV